MADIERIRSLIHLHFDRGRTRISQILCEELDWKQPSGRLKEYACRDLLLRLEEWGYIHLPPRKRSPEGPAQARRVDELPMFDSSPILRGDLHSLTVRLIDRHERREWRGLVGRFHYLGDKVIAGEHLLYHVFLEERLVACLAWGSPARNSSHRETYIGWDALTKRQHLYYVVNNLRFLILPWVTVKNLASRILALNVKRLSDDWQKAYGHPVYLAETFVDTSRFQGTCYKAANWIYLGQTKGLSKRGNVYYKHGNKKALFVYPLHAHAKDILCGRRT
jgi:hypothetical protein